MAKEWKSLDEMYESARKIKFEMFGVKMCIVNFDAISVEWNLPKKLAICDVAAVFRNGVNRVLHGKEYKRYIISVSFKAFARMRLSRTEKRAIIAHEIGHILQKVYDENCELFYTWFKRKGNRDQYRECEMLADAFACEIIGDYKPVVHALERSMIDYINLKKNEEIKIGTCYKIEESIKSMRLRIEAINSWYLRDKVKFILGQLK